MLEIVLGLGFATDLEDGLMTEVGLMLEFDLENGIIINVL